MKTSHILLLLAIILIVRADDDNIGKQKSMELREKTINSPNGVLKFTKADYQKYVMESPRPYEIVIYFTASKCQFCEEKELEFNKASEFYKAAEAYKASRVDNKRLRAVYFAVITFSEDTRKIYQDLDFKSAPHLVVFTPKMAILSNEERQNYLKRFKWSITPTDGHVTVHKILEYINKHTDRNVEYKPSLIGALTVIGVILSTLAAGVFIFVTFRSFFINPKVWLVGSIIIYIICSGGLVHNIIHNIPLTMTNQKGETEFFSSKNRQQLGAEGFIMSTTFTIAALSMILWIKLPRIIPDPSKQALAYLVLFIFTFLVIGWCEDKYQSKGWYNPRFWAPDTYVKGPLMRDQGNNI